MFRLQLAQSFLLFASLSVPIGRFATRADDGQPVISGLPSMPAAVAYALSRGDSFYRHTYKVIPSR